MKTILVSLGCICWYVAVFAQTPDTGTRTKSHSAPEISEAQALNREAAHALAAHEYSLAIETLEHARELAPRDLTIASNLGLAYVQCGRYRDAIEPLQRGLLDPNSADKARFLLGVSYYQLREFERAAVELEPLRSNSKHAENVLYLLEESYRQSHNPSKAERAFSDLMSRYPDSALVHKLLGTAYDAQDRFQDALSEFQRAAEIDPRLPEVRFAAGLMFLKLHDESAARKWLQEEIALNSCFAPALYYLGEIEKRANHLSGCSGFLPKGYQLRPEQW